MIARLTGVLDNKNPGNLIIMTGGVGYDVHIPLSTFYDLPDEGAEVSLFIQTVVREDAFELFGFLTKAEKEAFLLLNTVSKIGPRLSMAIVSGINPAELVEAVRMKNLARLSSIPGVGTKTAERLVVELKDKVAKLSVAQDLPTQIAQPPMEEVSQDVVSALLNLGYNRNEAVKAVGLARDEAGPDEIELSDLLRLSLKKLRKD